MDMQQTQMGYMADATPLLQTISETIQFARENGIPVIYVAVSFREGYPEFGADHHVFGAIKHSNGIFTKRHEGTQIHAAVAPLPGEIIVYKKRVSAFAGNDLELILRAQNIRSLVLTGFASSGVVLSTLRDAADKDYDLTVLSDACADPDPAIHTFLVNKIFPFSGKVMTSLAFMQKAHS